MFEIPIVAAGFSSAHDDGETVHDRLFDHGVPATQRLWRSASEGPQVIEAFFDGLYEVDYLAIREAGSDRTTDRFACAIHMTDEDGIFRQEPEHAWRNTNLRLGAPGTDFSREGVLRDGYGELCSVLSELKIGFVMPVRSNGIQLRLDGHGPLSVRSLMCLGKQVSDSALLRPGTIPTELPVVWRRPGFT